MKNDIPYFKSTQDQLLTFWAKVVRDRGAEWVVDLEEELMMRSAGRGESLEIDESILTSLATLGLWAVGDYMQQNQVE